MCRNASCHGGVLQDKYFDFSQHVLFSDQPVIFSEKKLDTFNLSTYIFLKD